MLPVHPRIGGRFGSEPRCRYRERVHSIPDTLETWVYSQEEYIHREGACGGWSQIWARGLIELSARFVDAFAMDRLKTRWYFHMWSQCSSASPATYKAETHRDDGLQSGISLVEDVTVGHRTFVSVALPFLCRCSSGCSIFHVLSLDGTLRRRSFCIYNSEV